MTHFACDTKHDIHFPLGHIYLDGFLSIPSNAKGLVIFVHGSGSGRFSSRNQQVAHILNDANLATFLFDLLTPEEDIIDSQTAELRFNIDFLASRLLKVTEWCISELTTYSLTIGYFGASTGGGAALVAAAHLPSKVKAIVSRGGRPDLANEFLTKVKAPTLLIVGGNDLPVIKMNEEAFSYLHCTKELKVIPGATHLFEEKGTLDQVALLSRDWFVTYLNSR